MKRILITGASTGIGAATAQHLQRSGMEVFAGVREAGEAPAGTRELILDVTDGDSIASAVASIGDRLDGVVNNAGIGIAGPLEVLGVDELREQLEVNVLGQVAVTQAALPLLRAGGHGRIVFVGSVGGQLASQFAGAYHASKFAVEAIADVWRQELEPEALSVILIEPSTISTPIWDRATARLDELLSRADPRIARYRERLDGFRETLQTADEHGKPPEQVAEAIEEALTADPPDTRYVVGADGKLATKLRPLIPDRLADKLAERGTA